jgi:hypothetical protein
LPISRFPFSEIHSVPALVYDRGGAVADRSQFDGPRPERNAMTHSRWRWLAATTAVAALALLAGQLPQADSACCYFSAKDKDILQPAQKVFLTYDPDTQVETFTVQPKFEGNADDFGMVIPTPAKPKLDEMPRDFFKELAVYTILKKRELPYNAAQRALINASKTRESKFQGKEGGRPSTVKVLEVGVVGNLAYKIITADRADDLYTWLKENNYSYAGDEATLDFYVKKKWFFTTMKIDTMQMKRDKDGKFAGEITPTRFEFKSAQFIYPLKITQLSVKDKTEALFYVQAPYKVDLPGEMTYQYQWVPMLQNARGWYSKGIFGDKELPGKGQEWLDAIKDEIPGLLKKGQELGFNFVSGQRPTPNKDGRIATTLEWAKKLTAEDIKVLTGEAPYSDSKPDVNQLFKEIGDPQERQKKIDEYHAKEEKDRPGGYLVREAPKEDIEQLKILKGHLKEGQFLTKFRKIFTKDEMNDDLLLLPAKIGEAQDWSEYEEILPTSPP